MTEKQIEGHLVRGVKALGEAKHVFTHQIWRMCGYDCMISLNGILAMRRL